MDPVGPLKPDDHVVAICPHQGVAVSRAPDDGEWSDVVVEDGAEALGLGEGDAVGGRREVEEEGFVSLEDGVAVDGDGDVLGFPGRACEVECA